MKRFSLAFLLLTVFSTLLSAQNKESLLDIRVDVIYLASDYLQGRETGTIGEDLAAEYIVSRFREIGLEAKGEANTYLQSFTFNYKTSPHAQEGEARIGKNVIAYLDNDAANTVVIGAHYDHLGRGAFGSRHLDGPIVHNGADDNASGIAALLYMAEQLKASDVKNNNYLFIAFSGEELGLYGSKHFVKRPTIDLKTVNYMLNMDMVGRMGKDRGVVINGAGTSPTWKEKLEAIKTSALQITTTDSGVGPSDHTSFYLAEMPVLHFFTGAHADYHKPSDDSERINFEGILDIADYMLALITQLDDKGKLAYSKTKDESQQKVSDFKVTLGVMPDYSYQGKGMRIDAVIEGRAAQNSGMKNGDVIIKMGEKKIDDIYDYMDSLGMFEKGQSTTAVVKRGKKEKKMKVTF